MNRALVSSNRIALAMFGFTYSCAFCFDNVVESNLLDCNKFIKYEINKVLEGTLIVQNKKRKDKMIPN